MAVSGIFQLTVQFRDSTTSSGVQSTKTLEVSGATEYTDGVVAIASGTVGTSTVSLNINALSYRNASGSTVTFSSISRAAFTADGANLVKLAGVGGAVIQSRASQPAASDMNETATFTVNVVGTTGTSAYTVLFYGS